MDSLESLKTLPQSTDKDNIPVIDFSLLTSTDHDQRSKAVHHLGKACEDWGIFMLVNHGVEERLMKGIIETSLGFFDLPEEEKREYEGKNLRDPIIYGSHVNSAHVKAPLWRDYLRFDVHPEFHCPNKPSGFREVANGYSKELRKISDEILKGISESLGLEPTYMHKAMNMESGLQQLAVNLYPPCQDPDSEIGLPPHTDLGLLNILIYNGVPGLQVYHNHKWLDVNGIPNAFIVNLGDPLEITTNGKYESVVHRAVVNSKTTRISITVGHACSSDTIIKPAPELIDDKTNPIAYIGTRYQDYRELKYNSKPCAKPGLDQVKINLND